VESFVDCAMHLEPILHISEQKTVHNVDAMLTLNLALVKKSQSLVPPQLFHSMHFQHMKLWSPFPVDLTTVNFIKIQSNYLKFIDGSLTLDIGLSHHCAEKVQGMEDMFHEYVDFQTLRFSTRRSFWNAQEHERFGFSANLRRICKQTVNVLANQ
jgi:hypothetical protein